MTHSLSKKELDEQFELFLKESFSDDSGDLGSFEKQPSAKSSEKSAVKSKVSWWQDDEHSVGGTRSGLSSSGKSFRKSLKKSHSIQEEDESPGDAGLKEEGLKTFVLSRDNTETEDSLKIPATSMGLDTLEEEEEKDRFFAQLEMGNSSSIDYSKLNRELDWTSSTFASNVRIADKALEQNDDGHKKAGVTETIRTSPGSSHYSEDFEDENDEKEPQNEKPKISSIIAKVSLYDSLDDTGEEERRNEMKGSLNRGHSEVKSGGSEMEALHEAYRQIHVVGDSDDYNPKLPDLSVEGKGRLQRSVLSPSPLQQAAHSLHPASTNESELPTAEELMKPIRMQEDHIRGFTLQPVSAVELDQENMSRPLERTLPDVPQLEHPTTAYPAANIKAAKELLCHPSSSHPNQDLIWSIRGEVERLMEDTKSTQASKAMKKPASRSSTGFHPSTSSVSKPTVAPVRGRAVKGRRAVTSRSSGISGVAATARTFSPQHLLKAKTTKIQEKEDCTADPGLRVSSELVESVQSIVAVLQQRIDVSSERDSRETHPAPKNNRDDGSSLVDELRVQLAQRERELHLMKDGAGELDSLRQHNYLLQSKLRSAEETSQRKRWAEATDPSSQETHLRMEKEIKEQETLIKGYQQENEKLCMQMKAQQKAMFNENQTLQSELNFTREQLSKTSKPVGNVCLLDHTQRITDLLAQIKTFQRNEAKLSEDLHRLKEEKQALDVDLQLLKKETDLVKVQAISSSDDKALEMSVLEEKHREEVSALTKKLQWFAENQELLDRDAVRLKAATTEIHKLKEQVENLKMEVAKRSGEHQKKAKEKCLDPKKMQDLQRQVKELEQILRRRNPNSLPALIYAAASAGREEDLDTAKVIALLEHRIQRLEAELEGHDEEAKRSLRAMEQRFHGVKLRYEQQISELEQQLEQKQRVEVESSAALEGNKPWTSRVQTLEMELQQMQVSHQEKEKSLHEQLESLRQQLKNRAQPSPSRHQSRAEAAFGVRIVRLNHELATKTRSIQELSRTVERLQKERGSMLCVPSPRAESQSTHTKRQAVCSATAEEDIFPAAHCEKTYQPTVFAGSHISEVTQENKALTQRLELLELQREQERGALEEQLRRLQEHSAEQLSSVKADHLRALDQLRAAHALEHSASKVAEQAKGLNAQEVKLKLLQGQVKELQEAKDALAVSRTRENTLQSQLTRLLKELKEAKEAQGSEVKLLCSLERKIINMELRHHHRETELEQVIGGSWQMVEANQHSEVDRWKHLAQEKSRKLEAFCLELNSILDILKHLQTQGVVFSPP